MYFVSKLIMSEAIYPNDHEYADETDYISKTMTNSMTIMATL